MERQAALKLCARLNKLFVAVISDALDEYQQGPRINKFLFSSAIRPILPEMRFAGIASTFKSVASTKIERPLPLEEEPSHTL